MLPKKMWVIILVFVLVISLPYLIGYLGNSTDYKFSGILQNPGDAYSYLAKMRQGFDGSWLFSLPFTPNPGDGRAIFLYYFFLGHIARLFNAPLILIYHLARIINSVLLTLSIAIFIKRIADKWQIQPVWVFFITLFGSGMGWIILNSGQVPTDLWVAEGYPFLSAYTNPHFPLALALMIASIYIWIFAKSTPKYVGLILSGLFLSIVLPFGSVILLILFGLDTGLNWFFEKKFTLNGFTAFGIGSLPYLVFSLIAIQTQPLLKIWNTQNITPSAPLYDLLLSFLPVFIFAIYGGIKKALVKDRIAILMLLWVIVGFGLSLLPLNLQRRFFIGIYIPFAIIAAYGVEAISKDNIRKYVRWAFTFLILPTNILVITISMYGIVRQDSNYYLHVDEIEGLSWLDQNGKHGEVVFASPADGLIIPALADKRVIYGHPFETPNAKEAKALVDFCLRDLTNQTCKNYLLQNQVKYLYLSQKVNEQPLQGSTSVPGVIVFQNSMVQIYEYRP